MAGDKELETILSKIARRIAMRRSSVGKVGYRTKTVKPESPHGIYRYDKASREWILVDRDGEGFKPTGDGYYIVYFDNTKCPACRLYDLFWYPFVETVGRGLEGVEFIIVLCEWFARRCDSRAASNTFREYNIVASPTTAFLEVRGGMVKRKELVRGVMRLEELIEKTMEFTGIKI